MADELSDESNPSVKTLLAQFLAEGGRANTEEFEAFCRANAFNESELRSAMAAYVRQHALIGEPVERGAHGNALADELRERMGANVDPKIDLGGTGTAGESSHTKSRAWQRMSEEGNARSHFTVGGELGAGGMGRILLARDETLRRSMAMKTIHPAHERRLENGQVSYDPRLIWRFLEEAQVTGQLDHPGIVPVHELGMDSSGRVYFTMKLVKGRDLDKIFAEVFSGQGAWTEARVLNDVLLRICDAMAFAHSKGVIHRDLKPSNIMVGEFGEVYVMDWGVARVQGRHDTDDIGARSHIESEADPVETDRQEHRRETPWSANLTQGGAQLGSPNYMSPEQARREWSTLDARSDVYAVGAMLYHLLARRIPYSSAGNDPARVVESVKEAAPTPLKKIRPDLPPELVTICEIAMSRDPNARYRDMRELANDLRAYLEHRVVERHAKGPIVELRKWVERNRLTALVLVGVVAIVVIGSGAFVWQRATSQWNFERSELLAAARKVDAERAVELARQAGGRGYWTGIVADLERAEEAGYPDHVELGVLKASSYLGNGRVDEAREFLESLALNNSSSAQRGRVHLLLDACYRNFGSGFEASHARIQLAVQEELSEPDKDYALGMLASSSDEALLQFDKVLARDPFNLLALHSKLSTLIFLGRYAELQSLALFMAALDPADPSAQIALALCEVANGHKGEAERIVNRMEPVVGAAAAQSGMTAIRLLDYTCRVSSTVLVGGSVSTADINSIPPLDPAEMYRQMAALALRLSTASGPLQGDQYRTPLVPITDPAMSAIQAVASVVGRLVNEPEECVPVLEAAAKHHDDGLIHLLHGAALITVELKKAEQQTDKLRRTLPRFESAMGTGSMFPKVAHIARYMSCRLYSDLIVGANDTSLIPQAVETVRAMRVDALTDWDEVSAAASVAMFCGIHTEGLRIVDDWLELHPEDFGARASRCKALSYLEAHERALQECEELLKLHPDSERVRSAHEFVKSRAKEAAKAPR